MKLQTGAGFKSRTLLQVTRENFRQVLPLLKEALDRCAYLALDLEFSGLSVGENAAEYYDDIEDRHEQVSQPFTSCYILKNITEDQM